MPTPTPMSFLNPFPGYPLTTSVATVAEDLAQWSGLLPSHVVVVDDEQRPQGAVAIAVLWVHGFDGAIARDKPLPGSFPGANLAPTDRPLSDYQPWLEEVVAVPMAAVLETNRPLEPGTWPPDAPAAACWVGVNAEGQYQGVLNLGALLARRLTSASPSATSAQHLVSPATPAPAIPASAQSWVIGLSHTLKTPLTSLLGLSTLLLDHRVGNLNDRQTRYVLLMRRAIRQLIRMVNQWVDWMRLETDQLDLDLQAVDLPALTESLVPTFLSVWQPDVMVQPPWASALTITQAPGCTAAWADRLRLRQSLHSVLDHLLQRGAEPRSLRVEPWGNWLGISLGAIAPAKAEQPMNPYEPAGLDQLGLTLARRLCQRQGGDLVGLWSSTQGYHLTLLLPQAGSGAASPDRTGTEQGMSAEPPITMLVLLVSPRDDLVDRVYALLQDSAHRLIVAPTWDAACDLRQRLHPGAVLLDEASLTDPIAAVLATLGASFAPRRVVRIAASPAPEHWPATVITPATLDHRLRPHLDSLAPATPNFWLPTVATPLTLLLWRGHSRGQVGLSEAWQQELQRCHCRLLQTDVLPHALVLHRVWQPQAIIIDSTLPLTAQDWHTLAQYPEIAEALLVTLVPHGPLPQRLRWLDASQALAYPVSVGTKILIQIIQAHRSYGEG